jgi:hypothetical protein
MTDNKENNKETPSLTNTNRSTTAPSPTIQDR